MEIPKPLPLRRPPSESAKAGALSAVSLGPEAGRSRVVRSDLRIGRGASRAGAGRCVNRGKRAAEASRELTLLVGAYSVSFFIASAFAAAPIFSAFGVCIFAAGSFSDRCFSSVKSSSFSGFSLTHPSKPATSGIRRGFRFAIGCHRVDIASAVGRRRPDWAVGRVKGGSPVHVARHV